MVKILNYSNELHYTVHDSFFRRSHLPVDLGPFYLNMRNQSIRQHDVITLFSHKKMVSNI